MKIALAGYQNSGRTTVFSALCDSYTESSIDKGRLKLRLGSSKIVDPRLEQVAQIYKSAKITLCEIQFTDFEYTQELSKRGFDEQIISQLKMVDCLIYIARGFVNPGIYYRFDSINPFRDAREIESDMILSDLASVEKRIVKLQFDMRKGKKELLMEYDLILKIRESLENEKPLRLQNFSPEQENFLRGFGFLTQKKGIVLINTDDSGEFPGDFAEIETWAHERKLDVLTIKGKLQSEVLELDESDRAEFLAEMDIDESAVEKVIRAIHNTAGLITFFTAGQNEARSWLLPAGSTAFQAAGNIHTDFQDKFIRAEVIKFNDLIKCGSEKACRDDGVFNSEKREYIVNDGDIILFRHN